LCFKLSALSLGMGQYKQKKPRIATRLSFNVISTTGFYPDRVGAPGFPPSGGPSEQE